MTVATFSCVDDLVYRELTTLVDRPSELSFSFDDSLVLMDLQSRLLLLLTFFGVSGVDGAI